MALVLCCAAMSAEAQEGEAPKPDQAVEAPPGEQPQIELSVPSNGAPAEPAAEEPAPLPPGTRDPFWPVGYVPPTERKVDAPRTTAAGTVAVVEKLEPPQWDLALKMLSIKGVMKSGSGYMAVINGQVTSENDTISTVFKNRTYSWRIAKIGKEGVRFERLDLEQQ